MFDFSELLLDSIHIIKPGKCEDDRGLFVKTFHQPDFLAQKLDFNVRESFYTISKKNVIRGMHFQVQNKAHSKLVYVPHGKIRDVILDIRRGSPTFGHYVSVELNHDNCEMVLIPKGFAHGFIALEDNTIVSYMVDNEHSPEHDQGIHWNSFGADWEVANPIVSKRDQEWPSFKDYRSPFIYQQD